MSEFTPSQRIDRNRIDESYDELSKKYITMQVELRALRLENSQMQRFIWWAWNVFAKNESDLTALRKELDKVGLIDKIDIRKEDLK